MPGRLIMDQQGASLSQDPKKDRSQAQTGSTSHAQDFTTKHATSPQAGGPNGVRAKEKSPLPPMTNGHVEVGAGPMVASSGTSSPPALDQSWRESHANKSMGVLIERLAQKCFSDLGETVAKMSDLPVPSASAQPNGISLHNIDTSADSLARKRMWMEFAQNQRDRFIKTLVLADWSRSGHDMAKLIDIRVWEDKQRNSQSNAISFIGTIKHNLMSAKMPNPNIEGALELLATGKASHIPDLGYLPPKRLTPKQLLRTLQNMNVTLVTRLNLHEDLPPHFNEYNIADGRATFRVAEEFEVDLSVADEDPASPFYFIDTRFLFSPTSHILNEQLRAALEVRCNSAMAGKGLQGCYDFLHNFVLTHKINILRGQADELKRGKWFDCLYINTPRRVLSVQYWSSRVGPKSWLEFGIATGKQKGFQSRKTPTPRLRVRWFREAVEVNDDSIDVDWQNIDLEKILFAAIAKHTSWLLRNLETRLNTMAGDQSKLKAILTTSAEVPEECSLDLTFQALRSPLTVKFDSVTGAISLSPPTPLNHNVEVRLNRDPKLDKPVVIANLLCSAVHDRVSKMAELLAWASVSGLSRQDNLSQLFGKDVLARSIYVCSKGWGSDWALVTTFSLSGERWWVVRLANKPGDKSLPPGRIISTARQVPVSDVSTVHPTISQQHLLRVERLAEAEVSFTTLSRQLVEMRIQHHFERLTSLTPEKISADTITPSSVAMYIKSSALLGDTLGRKKSSWATEFVRITHETVEPAVAVAELLELRHDIRVTVKSGRLSHLQKRLVHSQQSDIAMNASEALALRIRVPFGKPFAEQLRARLHSVERLDHYLAILESQNFRCIGMDLSKITFRYGESLPLTAQLSFSKDGSLPVRLKFEPQGNNPHQRMRAMLEKHINGQNKDFFTVLTKTLSITLPLLQSLDQIESRDISRASVLVHVRQPLWFNLTYKSPLPPCAFEIRCRNKQLAGKAELLWHISRSERPGSPTMPESITAALRELYQSQEKDWWGIGGGIVAKPAAVGDVLEQLDNTMRKFEGVEIKPPPEELDAKPLIQQTTVKTAPPSQPPKPQQAPQQTQPQPQPMQRQPSQQRQAPVMQRQASQQATAPMQRQASQQHTQQMQRQLSQQQMQRNFAQQQQQQQGQQGQGPRPQMTAQQRMQLFQQQQQAQQQAQQPAQQQKPRPMSANAGYLPQNRPPNGAAPPNTRGDVIEID